MSIDWKKLGIFAGGILFGTAGIRILSSDDAKKLYKETTAAVLRGQSCIMTAGEAVRESCGDIYADAREINRQRAARKAEQLKSTAEDIADTSEQASPSCI